MSRTLSVLVKSLLDSVVIKSLQQGEAHSDIGGAKVNTARIEVANKPTK